MEIFGVGILELVLILVIAIIVLGPEGMVKTARSFGVWMRKLIKSPIWSQLMDTQRELRDMPTRLVREAGLEEDLRELKRTSQDVRNLNIRATAAAAASKLIEEGEARAASEPSIAPPRASMPANTARQVSVPQAPPEKVSEPPISPEADDDSWAI